MKRVVGLVLALMVMVSGVQVFADDVQDFWNAFTIDIRSGHVKVSFSIENSKELLKDANIVDLAAHDISFDMDLMYKMSPDYKKLEMYVDYNLKTPLSFYDDSYARWLKLDLSDRNVPKIKEIRKYKTNDKYEYIDVSAPAVIDLYHSYDYELEDMKFDKDAVTGYIDNVLKKHINPVYGDGEYNIGMNDSQLKALIKEMVVYEMEQEFVAMDEYEYGYSEEEKKNIREETDQFFESLNSVKVFADNAFSSKVTLNDKKQPRTVVSQVNIDTNLKELSKVFGDGTDDYFNNGNTDVNLSMNFSSIFDKINEDLEITYPNLTPENSEEHMHVLQIPELNTGGVNVVRKGKLVTLKNQGFVKDGVTYLPLRECLNTAGLRDGEIIYDPDTNSITVWSDAVKKQFVIDSSIVRYAEDEIDMGAPVLSVDGVAYVPVGALRWMDFLNQTRNFFAEDESVIGSVVYIYRIFQYGDEPEDAEEEDQEEYYPYGYSYYYYDKASPIFDTTPDFVKNFNFAKNFKITPGKGQSLFSEFKGFLGEIKKNGLLLGELK